jgi:probable F420-dependent oxidoreductase|nr:putative F420-dependent oxidoreductase, family [Aeromicrobium sp.]
MKLDLYPGLGLRLEEAAELARLAESTGLEGLWSLEAQTEPFMPLAIALEATNRIDLRTAIAVALARNPMIVAHTAHELNRVSGGRFQLGLGPQVKPHIERRYGLEWSQPVARMSEYIDALHAIWRSWNTGERLDFEGQFFRHTLMTPMFSPPPSASGTPPVLLAAVGPRMVAMAVEKADGIIAHPLSSRLTLTSGLLPAVAAAGRAADRPFEISCPVLVITGGSDAAMHTAREATRKQIAFYASTPAYRSVLEQYDEGDRADRLRLLSRERRWDDMTDLVTDELMTEFAVEAAPSALAGALMERFRGVLDRVGLYAPYEADPEVWSEVMGGRGRAL